MGMVVLSMAADVLWLYFYFQNLKNDNNTID